MNSSIYRCKVYYTRNQDIRKRYLYSIFLLYIDHAEISTINKRLILLGINKKKLFSIYLDPSLKMKLPYENHATDKTTSIFISSLNKKTRQPFSFSFCFDKDMIPVCCLGTIKAKKDTSPQLYLMKNAEKATQKKDLKYFRHSNINNPDNPLEINISVPGKTFTIYFSGFDPTASLLFGSLHGKRKKLHDLNLIKCLIDYFFSNIKTSLRLLLGFKNHPIQNKSV